MPKMVCDIKLYNLKELSEMLGVTTVTLRSYLKDKEIIGRKIGTQWYVTEEAIKDFLNPVKQKD